MKFTMGRTMKILVAILIVAIIAIVMLSPYSFEKYTASSKMIQVTSTDTVTKDANGKKKQQVYSYKKDDKKADLYIESAEKLFDRAVKDGWNADGEPGIVYTTDWNGKPVVHDRMHWVLAEAINTSAVLWHVTGKQKYADAYAGFMEYLDEKVLDHKNGSWFHQMDCNNVPSNTVWPGKPDLYHAVQATLIPYYVPDLSIAVAVKEGKRI